PGTGVSILKEPYLPIGEHAFANKEDFRIFFKEDKNGAIEYLVIGENAYKKLKWYQQSTFQGVSLLLVVLSALIVVMRHLFRRKKNVSTPARAIRTYRRWSLGLAIAVLSFVGLLLLGFATLSTTYEVPVAIKGILLIPHLIVLGVIALGIATWAFLKQPDVKKWRKATSIVYCLIMLYAVWFLNHWNLLFYKL
ncbi:MAG: hypothetical protein AAF466_07595, partial [Bacteroidota bacterium]